MEEYRRKVSVSCFDAFSCGSTGKPAVESEVFLVFRLCILAFSQGNHVTDFNVFIGFRVCNQCIYQNFRFVDTVCKNNRISGFDAFHRFIGGA
jgi:hypothetical protein